MITTFSATLLFGCEGDSKELLELLVKTAEEFGYPIDYIEVLPSYTAQPAVYQWPRGHMFDINDTEIRVKER